MISTRYGTQVDSIIGTNTDVHGNLYVVCFLKGMSGMREIFIGDLKADRGAAEIDSAINALPEDRRIVEAVKP